MNQLIPEDLNFVLSRLPRDVLALVQKHKLYIAGGFIRATIAGEPPSDIDIFGASKEQLKLLALALAVDRGANSRVHETENAYTVLAGNRLPVQFIHRWLYAPGEHGDLIYQFDFTIAQAAIWCEDQGKQWRWQSCTCERFYTDLAARRLVYTHPQRNEDAGGSLLRARKFLAKGYNIQPLSFAGVIARLVRSVEPHALEDEKLLTKVLTGLLREVDPLTVVDGVDLVDEHELLSEQAKEEGL